MCHITLRVGGVGSRLYHLRYQRIGWGGVVRLGSAAHELEVPWKCLRKELKARQYLHRYVHRVIEMLLVVLIFE